MSKCRHSVMKSDLLPGGDVSLQPCPRKLLFESAQLPVQCWLEHLACGMRLDRFSGEHWEEILLIQGDLNWNRNFPTDVYLCLTPEQTAPPFCAGNAGAVLLRMIFGSMPGNDHGPTTAAQGKPSVAVADFGLLTWNEIPARRANDPGARIAELSTNASRTRITSLMDCRPGWILDDHDHPSDVLTFCVRGGGILGIGEKTTIYEAGHLVTIPAGRRHRFQTGNEGALLAVFVFEPFLARAAE
jgi:quercetin dioxygenase-like cupin family protein